MAEPLGFRLIVNAHHGFNEGYHAGYNSALGRAANEMRTAANFLRSQGQTSQADAYDTCARELVGMMRTNPAAEGL
jgi:hypothetical protein